MFKQFKNISSIIKLNVRYCTSNKNTKTINEIVKTIDPFSQLKIKSAYNITIRPYDLLNCPDSNKLRITSLSKQLNKSSSLNMTININDKIVEINSDDENVNEDENVTCLLEVPIKADLNIQSKGSIDISEMYSDNIHVAAKKNIQIKNIRSTIIDLFSIDGNIDCKGIMLGKKIELLTKNKGNIFLDKLQGDLLQCKTDLGDISVNSCYIENSKFATENGNLNLRNIHKKSEIFILEKGNIEMSGIHGNVYVKSTSGDMNLQFSEIFGENIIIAEDSENIIINVSDVIEHDSFIEIHSDSIELESSLSHLLDCLKGVNKNHFVIGQEISNDNKLMICTKGNLKLGKMSWAESVKIAMGIKDI